MASDLIPANALPINTVAPDAALDTDEVGTGTKPASLFFLLELFRARGEKEKKDGDRYEIDWSRADHKCAICMDEIEKPWESLTMPCSHIFHETCIIRWLERTHVCPLCRFEMPTEDY